MTSIGIAPDDIVALRQGLASLPRADNVAPNASIDPDALIALESHRAALDPERALVVGNRGMGKSFWAHALANADARDRAADAFPEIAKTTARLGFNASDMPVPFAPTLNALRGAVAAGTDADVIWRSVLLRAAVPQEERPSHIPFESLTQLCSWTPSHSDEIDQLLAKVDHRYKHEDKRLVVVFDALDQLGTDWKTTEILTRALLKRALAVRSFRAIRFKLFMRSDQFETPRLFEFPDGSKIRNSRVDLRWSNSDLYWLLFKRLEQSGVASQAFARLTQRIGQFYVGANYPQKAVVDELAGEFMGANEKRGRVFTWLPLHLADARGETSPRTFLTAWREAARHLPRPTIRAVDHSGLIEGVRKASEDRLTELQEDYWWIREALGPLRGQMVPIEKELLMKLWRENGTTAKIRTESSVSRRAPILLESMLEGEEALLKSLDTIGVLELRTNGKINVPDIFRVDAGIKRKGGVKPPKQTAST